MTLTKQKFSEYMAIIVCLTPMLVVYDSSIISYIQLFSFSIYIFVSMKEKNFSVNGSPLALYCIYTIVISVFMGVILSVNSVAINRSISSILFVLFLIYAKNDEKINKIKIIYKYIAAFCVVFFVLQFFCFYILHKGIMFQIPGFQLKENLQNAYKYLSLASAYGSTYVRFPGPFSEPSIYAEYVMPLIAFYLFGCRGVCKRSVIKAVVIAMTVLMSTSGIGIVMVAVCFTVYALIYSNNKLIVILSVVIVIAVAIVTYSVVPEIKLTVDNLFVVGNINSSNSKADYRLYRGIEYFSNMPILHMIFGIGLYNAEAFASHVGIINAYDRAGQAYEYFNGFSQIFIYTGIIGTVLLMIYFGAYVKFVGSNLRKTMFILYFALIIGSSALFDGIGLIYLVLLFVIDNTRETDMVVE